MIRSHLLLGALALVLLAPPAAAQGPSSGAQSLAQPTLSVRRDGALMVDQFGALFAIGRNATGRLGTGDTMDRDAPTAILGLPTVAEAALGDRFGFSVARNGSVWSWGEGDSGALGTGDTDDVMAPEALTGLPPIRAVAAGSAHALLLDENGNVWSSGNNESGQLGRGMAAPMASEDRFDQISGLDMVIAIAASAEASYALREATPGMVELWVFGENADGQLGTGDTADVTQPTQVTILPSLAQIAVGRRHALALDASGNVWSWGRNRFGQLGLGGTTQRETPERVNGLGPVARIGAGAETSFFVERTGATFASGSLLFGELGVGRIGSGASIFETTPVAATDLDDALAIDGGLAHTLAISRDGEVLAFGNGTQGQLGLGPAPVAATPTPTPMPGFRLARPVALLGAEILPPGERWDVLIATVPPRPLRFYRTEIALGSSANGPLVAGSSTLRWPLSRPLFYASNRAVLAPISSGFEGVLDPMGEARLSLVIPNDPILVGFSLQAATVVFDAAGLPEVVSAARQLDIGPPSPVLTRISPVEGSVLGGTTVTLEGRRFTPGMLVGFGRALGTSLTLISPTRATVLSPPGPLGPVDVGILDPASNGLSRITNGFEYILTDPTPTIARATPNRGHVAGGDRISLTGTNFRPGALITVGGTAALNVMVASPERLSFDLPSAPLGTADVEVRNPAGAPALSRDLITYIADATIAGISPLNANPGDLLLITGSGFFPRSSVTVGGVPATLLASSENALQVRMPTNSGCDLTVAVSTGAQSVSTTIRPSPTIGTILGDGTVSSGGGALFVVGTGFAVGVSATVDGAAVPVQRTDATSLVVTVPARSPNASALLEITTPSGCRTSQTFRYGF